MSEAVTEAEVVEEPGTEVVPAEQVGTTLFRTSDPAVVLTRAVETANALMPVIREKDLIANIKGRDHLKVEAWTTLGAMLGVTPVCTWTRKLDNGWEARVEARTLDGRVIGAAEAECLRDESTWKERDDFALRSMAQTRATSKALASVLRFVATLGGAAGTPAEEMPREGDAKTGFASPKQEDFFKRLLKGAGGSEQTVDAICAYAAAALTGERDGPISQAIDGLKDEATRADTARALAEQANEWQTQQSDVPADTEGLPDLDPEVAARYD